MPWPASDTEDMELFSGFQAQLVPGALCTPGRMPAITCLALSDSCRGRLALWVGGVISQSVLPVGSVDDLRREVAELVPCLAKDSGYVFCRSHNFLAEISPEKIIARYESASTADIRMR